MRLRRHLQTKVWIGDHRAAVLLHLHDKAAAKRNGDAEAHASRPMALPFVSLAYLPAGALDSWPNQGSQGCLTGAKLTEFRANTLTGAAGSDA